MLRRTAQVTAPQDPTHSRETIQVRIQKKERKKEKKGEQERVQRGGINVWSSRKSWPKKKEEEKDKTKEKDKEKASDCVRDSSGRIDTVPVD